MVCVAPPRGFWEKPGYPTGYAELKAAGLLDPRPAIAALGAKGSLPGLEDVAEEDDETEEDAEELLASDFGEDLVPGDDTTEDSAAGPPVTAIGGPEEP